MFAKEPCFNVFMTICPLLKLCNIKCTVELFSKLIFIVRLLLEEKNVSVKSISHVNALANLALYPVDSYHVHLTVLLYVL